MSTIRRAIALTGTTALLGGVLTVGSMAPAGAGSYHLTNGAPVPIADNVRSNSFLNVNGVGGVITDLNVTLDGFGHDDPFDVDLMLIGPTGVRVPLMSDACGDIAVEDQHWTIDDEAANQIPFADCAASGAGALFRPTDYFAGDFWPPGQAPSTTLSAFDGSNPNGRWRLFVADDELGGAGDIEGGWTVTIITGPAPIRLPASDTGAGKASSYPRTKAVSGRTGVVSDVDVTVKGVWHGRPDDIDLLLVGPRGQKVLLMSDACGGQDATSWQYDFSDENTAKLADGANCERSAVRPTNFGSGDLMPGPAPPGPYGTKLSVFDGTNPNGTWRFYFFDDRTNESGFLTVGPKLIIKTAPAG